MLRNILAVIAGGLTNAVIVLLVETLNSRAFPLPAGTDHQNPDQLAAALHDAPAAMFLVVLGGIILASFLSGLVAARIATQPRRVALIVGGLLLVTNALNAFSFWHPLWFRVAVLVLPLPLALLGGRVGERRTLPAQGPANK